MSQLVQLPLPPFVCVRICALPSTTILSAPLLKVNVRPIVSRWHWSRIFTGAPVMMHRDDVPLYQGMEEQAAFLGEGEERLSGFFRYEGQVDGFWGVGPLVSAAE